MKTKSIRSSFFALVAVFLAAVTAVPFAAPAQSASSTVEQRLRKALDKRAELESQIREIEREREEQKQEKARIIPLVSREEQIESIRERIEKLDRTIGKLKDEATREAQGANETKAAPSSATVKSSSSASERQTAKPKEMSLLVRQAIAGDLNRQGFRLLQSLAEEKETENKFISPYSLDSAFGMV